MHHSQQRVIKPLPREPRLALRGGRKRVDARDGVRRENLLTVPDVPSNISISQRTIGERTDEQRPERKQEDQVAYRRKKKTLPTFGSRAARRANICCLLICGSHDVCWYSCFVCRRTIWMIEKHQATGSKDVAASWLD